MEDSILSWYSGYKGREYPLVFRFAGKQERTEELLSEKLIEEKGTRRQIRAFLVKTAEGQLFEILVGKTVEIKPQITSH
jgi:hypothetical protein